MNNLELVKEIDDLKHKIKVSPRTEMLADFSSLLNAFIYKWGLGWDSHNFARLPK